MQEWLNWHAWKACVRATVPWVRIPPSPLFFLFFSFFSFCYVGSPVGTRFEESNPLRSFFVFSFFSFCYVGSPVGTRFEESHPLRSFFCFFFLFILLCGFSRRDSFRGIPPSPLFFLFFSFFSFCYHVGSPIGTRFEESHPLRSFFCFVIPNFVTSRTMLFIVKNIFLL